MYMPVISHMDHRYMISMSTKRSRNLRNWKGRLDLPQETRELVFLYDMVQHKSNLEHTYSVHA